MVHVPGELFSYRKTAHCLVSAFKQEHHELLKVILTPLEIDLETDQKWQILSTRCSPDSKDMENIVSHRNHCISHGNYSKTTEGNIPIVSHRNH